MKRLVIIAVLLLIGTIVFVKTTFSPRQDLSPAPAGNMVTINGDSFLMVARKSRAEGVIF